MISHKLRAVFIHIPKCGGTSIERILDKQSFVYQKHPHICHRELDSNHDNYFKFAFVRNPFDKLVSEYKWFTNTEYKYPCKRVKDFYKGVDFKTFLKKFTDWPTRKSDHWYVRGDYYHGLDYMHILQPIGQMDFIGRFENLQQDFDFICDKIDIPRQKLPHIYKSNHRHYTEYYDAEAQEIVAKRYGKDIEHFGYKFM